MNKCLKRLENVQMCEDNTVIGRTGNGQVSELTIHRSLQRWDCTLELYLKQFQLNSWIAICFQVFIVWQTPEDH